MCHHDRHDASAPPVRVCFVIENLLPAGTERWLEQLVMRLDRHRVLPSLCLTDGRQSSAEQLDSLQCPVLRLKLAHLKTPAAVAAFWRMRRFLQQERVDAIQVHHADPTYLGVPVARSLGIRPIIQTKYDVGYWLQGADLRAHRWLRPWVDLTIANCQASRQAAVAQERAPENQVVVVENGIDMARFQAVPPLEIDQLRAPRVGMLANLRPIKDPFCLFDAATILLDASPIDWTFHLAGQGELFDPLRQAIALSGRERQINLHGSVDAASFLRDVAIVVLCSRSEGLPHALIEAMAAGRVVVASDVGGNRELVEHDRTGLLVPAGEPQMLANALDRLRRNPEHALRLASAGREHVTSRFSSERMLRTLEDLYQSSVRTFRKGAAIPATSRDVTRCAAEGNGIQPW